MKFSRKTLGIPYAVFLLLFVVAPLVVLFYYAFTNGKGYFTLKNLTDFFTDPNTLGTLFYSLMIALATTVVCLLIAYPVAYILATSKLKSKSVIIMIFVMPMWINFSLRITALKEILTLIEGNLALYPFLNSVIGMTYDFLPFMILPIYNTIVKLDGSLTEAARDLGADERGAFLRVTLPLSLPGVISGIQMVFMPSLTFYMIPDILNEGSKTTIGNTVQNFILNESTTYNQAGNVLSLLLLIFVLITMGILRGQDKEAGGGMAL